MKSISRSPELDRPVAYQIKVRGRLDASWSDWFGGMAVRSEEGSDGSPVTTLTGTVADQSVLRGILNGIWDLNLTLISANRIGIDGK